MRRPREIIKCWDSSTGRSRRDFRNREARAGTCAITLPAVSEFLLRRHNFGVSVVSIIYPGKWAGMIADGMKTKHEHKAEKAAGSPVTPTAFEQLDPILHALKEEMDGQPDAGAPRPKSQLPGWCRNITRRLGQTILRPVIKLRPNGRVNWRNYGRMVGLLERAVSFYRHDVPRIIEQELGDMTAEDWKRIEPVLGLEKLRSMIVKRLNRVVADDEPLEELVDEAMEQMLAGFQRQREIALRHVAGQSPKVARLFYKGISEGYELFLDASAKFCGDRGRASIHLDLLACMLEVEKLRRTSPPTTRSQFYDRLTPIFNLTPRAYDWFNDVCDDIKLPLNNLGRKRQSASAGA